MKTITTLGLLLSLGACSTVTIRDKGTSKLSSDPSYESSKSYFFWGLGGEHHVDVKKVCGSSQPVQMQAQSTVVDSLLSIVTFGIYYPRTAKVWCK